MRWKTAAVWLLRVLLAVLFGIQGVVKLLGSPAWIARFSRWGYPSYFYLLVGLAELAGAVLLIAPKTAKAGAVVLITIMIGATVTHLLHREPQVATTLVLLVMLGAVLVAS